MPYFAFVSKGTSLLQLVLLLIFLLITLSFGEESSNFGGNSNFGANTNENLDTTVVSVSLTADLGSESATSANVKRWVSRPARSLPTAQVVVPSNGNGVYADSDTLENLFTQLEILRPCNRVLNSSLVKRLISESQQSREVQRNLSSVHSFLSQLVSTPVYLANAIELEKSLPKNSSFTSSPAVFPNSKVDPSPAYGLQLQCDEFTRHWVPVAVYPTKLANSFLQVPLAEARLDACGLTANQCSSKCSYTVIHRQLRIWARSCSGCEDNNSLDRRFCREDLRSFHRIFYAISVLFAMASVLMIVLVIRERHRQQQEARGWALMEPFFLGAALLYIIPLLDWYSAESERSSCCIASWLRAFGFTLFYGSVLLKIYRNLQEYRVRKAYHVIVRENDLVKILILVLLFTFTALVVWTVSSSKNSDLWDNSWPQCPMGSFEFMWAGCELTILLYGMRLCYKARSSSWVERWQFTLAVCLEAVVTLSINLVRYSLNNTGSNDALFIATIIQIHLTISINIGAIITPKFLVSSESSRRTLTISGGGIGNSGRAHPSLAKLRDNLINGTVDFAEIPIVDMNPEDIRAELKRVYTQLRMYKLKNLYQDNPHISKRKGGGKKPNEKTGKNRRISIPPASSSPKVRRVDEMEDEKSDLTVESAPHNIYLSTNKIQLEANDQSVRMSRSSKSRKTSKPRKCEVASSHASDKELDLKRIIKHHLIDGARQQQYELWELHLLLQAAKKSFQAMETLVELQAPVNICGDIHGQYSDLLRIFEICGLPYKNKYLFLGDYVDRGRHSLEVIILLLALKIQFPKHFFLLRGNHEVRKINNVYGFKDELTARFPDINDWGLLHTMFNEVFGEMPLAAVVSGKVLCMHGGISPELNSLDDIRRLKRPIHTLKDKLVQDLIWADPQIGIEGFQPNTTRAISVVFGEDAVYSKLKQLDCDIIVRAHQVTEFGHAFFANRKLVTVFSASRYYEEICNWGSVAVVDADLKMYFKSFKPQEYDSNSRYKKEPDTADDGEE